MKRWTLRILLTLAILFSTVWLLDVANSHWLVGTLCWCIVVTGSAVAVFIWIRRDGLSIRWAILGVINIFALLVYTVPLLFLGAKGITGHLAGTPADGWIILAAATPGVMFHVASTVLLIRAARRTKRLDTLCPTCTYDLQGSPDTGCPECGWGRRDSAER